MIEALLAELDRVDEFTNVTQLARMVGTSSTALALRKELEKRGGGTLLVEADARGEGVQRAGQQRGEDAKRGEEEA